MTAVPMQQERGSRLPVLEKYDVIEELGHGGMATVYRARDLRLERDVAVKVIHPHLRDSAEAVRRFAIEARAVAKLRHPSIVEVYDVSAASDAEQFLVVELLRGVTLRRLFETHGALPAEVAAAIGVELLGALGHAHDAGVIHRDVKPENVIIEHRATSARAPSIPDDSAPRIATTPSSAPASRGDRVTIKLTDFGIAKLLDAQGVTSTGQVLGSPAHMAPEQIEGREVDGRADVFGLGVLLYECMVGHLPFVGNNPAQVLRRVLDGEYAPAENEVATVGRVWSRILDQALNPSVEARFASAGQMRDALQVELARLGVVSPKGEVERWFDDPAGYAKAHDAALAVKLCTLGEAASRRRDVLAAAADYNRALAYAPDDPSLLRIVSSMRRRRARADALRRAWPLAAFVAVTAGAAVGFASWRHARAPVVVAEPLPPVAPVALPAPSTDPAAPPVGAGLNLPARALARPAIPLHVALPRVGSRDVRFAAPVEPAQGVKVSIDGTAPIPIDPARGLALDDRAHTLTFSCERDLCDPVTRAVPAGGQTVTLPVRLTIHPAMLVVRGVPGNRYVLGDDPTRTLVEAAEGANTIQMTQSAARVVTVNEIGAGRRSQRVELRAGETRTVDFIGGL